MEFYWQHSWKPLVEKYNLNLTRKRFYSFAGVPVPKIVSTLIEETDSQSISVDDFLKEKRLLVEAARKVPANIPKSIPSTLEIIEYNFKRSVPMAIASSGYRDHVLEGLRDNGLMKYFDNDETLIITQEAVKNWKPHPDIFLLAAKRLGLPPTECRGFEDADAGMQALRAAKMSAVDVRKMKLYPHKFD